MIVGIIVTVVFIVGANIAIMRAFVVFALALIGVLPVVVGVLDVSR